MQTWIRCETTPSLKIQVKIIVKALYFHKKGEKEEREKERKVNYYPRIKLGASRRDWNPLSKRISILFPEKRKQICVDLAIFLLKGERERAWVYRTMSVLDRNNSFLNGVSPSLAWYIIIMPFFRHLLQKKSVMLDIFNFVYVVAEKKTLYICCCHKKNLRIPP